MISSFLHHQLTHCVVISSYKKTGENTVNDDETWVILSFAIW
jgi:hypothetical protein